MNISQRLRTCARHTGLDAVIELLTEAADEIDALQARAQVQGEPVTVAADHFDNGPFEAYTNRIHPPVEIGTKLYTTPQPAQATQAEVTDAVAYAIHQVIKPPNMTDADWHSGAMLGHENEYREKVEQAATRAILALRPAATFCGYCGGNDEDPVDHCMDCTRPAAVPMTDEALWTAVIEHLGPEALSGGRMSILDAFHLGITVAEAHHGITAQAKKEDE